MGGILADLKFALRTLRRSPLFTLIAVLSLALGIGANTAIFSLMDQLLLRLLPVKDPESLVMLSQRGTNMGGNDGERAFWINSLERGEIGDGDLDHAIGLMTKHRALEDTINRAQHYGAMAVDALALFPASPMKTALEQVVAFCLARSH